MRIGVFDSGVGGTSVLKEILKLFPNEDIIYFGDSLHAPYGDREIEEIKNLCLKVSDFLVYNKKVDILVIACNTATGVGKEVMEERYSIPVIGVVENGVKEAIKLTKNGKIGVLATSATVKMGVYRREILKLSNDKEVIEVEAPLLVGIIENGWKDTPENMMILDYYIKKLPTDVDTLILGCTHYPLIRESIEKFFKATIIDPAFETVNSMKSIVKNKKDEKASIENVEFYVTGDIDKFKKVTEKFLGKRIEKIKNVVLD